MTRFVRLRGARVHRASVFLRATSLRLFRERRLGLVDRGDPVEGRAVVVVARGAARSFEADERPDRISDGSRAVRAAASHATPSAATVGSAESATSVVTGYTPSGAASTLPRSAPAAAPSGAPRWTTSIG